MHQNLGTITLNADVGMTRADPSTCLIVTGVGRSGTSMMSAVLAALGVPMGPDDGLAVGEDQEFRAALLGFDHAGVRTLIERRRAAHPVWGLKFPSLQNHLHPPQLLQFPGARMIVVMRDTIATAARATLSDPEQTDGAAALVNVAKQIVDMTEFAMRAPVPVLLLSYEKCVAFPRETVGAIAAFCGLPPDAGRIERAVEAIEPNNTSYIRLFHAEHDGYIDGIIDDHLVGWARSRTHERSVRVDVVADGRLLGSCVADEYRGDLEQAGVSHGRFGFRLKLPAKVVERDAKLQVFVVTRNEMIYGSNRTVSALSASRERVA